MSGSEGSSGHSTGAPEPKKQSKAKVSRTSLILWHTHQNDVVGVRKLLEEDRSWEAQFLAGGNWFAIFAAANKDLSESNNAY